MASSRHNHGKYTESSTIENLSQHLQKVALESDERKQSSIRTPFGDDYPAGSIQLQNSDQTRVEKYLLYNKDITLNEEEDRRTLREPIRKKIPVTPHNSATKRKNKQVDLTAHLSNKNRQAKYHLNSYLQNKRDGKYAERFRVFSYSPIRGADVKKFEAFIDVLDETSWFNGSVKCNNKYYKFVEGSQNYLIDIDQSKIFLTKTRLSRPNPVITKQMTEWFRQVIANAKWH